MNDKSLNEIKEMTQTRYINPYTDFGFKKLFGTPLNKELLAQYTPEERQDYEDSLKVYRDLKNVLDTAELRGLEKGRAEAYNKTVKSAMTMKADGMSIELISKYTGLTREEIEKI